MNINIKCKTIKLRGKHTGENLQKLGLGEELLDVIPKHMIHFLKIDKMDFIKIRTFALGKTLLRG